MTLRLSKSDPIVQRAMEVTSPTLTEVGFIPDDDCGCKIYAKKVGNYLTIVGMHSTIYGCVSNPFLPNVVIVEE